MRLVVTVSVGVPVVVPVWEGLPEPDTVAVKVLEGVAPVLSVPVPLRVLLGVREGVALPVRVREGVALPVREKVGVALLEGVTERVGVKVGVGAAVGVNVGEVVGLLPTDSVAVAEPVTLGVTVPLSVVVAVVDTDGVNVGVVDRLLVAEGVGVFEVVGDRVAVTVAVNVLEGEEPELGVPVPLRVLLGVMEGVRLSVGDTEGVALPERVTVGVTLALRVPLLVRVGDREGVPVGLLPADGVPEPAPGGLWLPVTLPVALDKGLASMVGEDELLAPADKAEPVVALGVRVGEPPREPDSLGVAVALAVPLGDREGDTVGEGVAEGGASAYTFSSSANTTAPGASISAPTMGRAAGVVKFHSSPPLALMARMEPPAVPSTLSPAACAAVTPDTGEPALPTAHTTSPVVRLSAKARLPHSANTKPAAVCVGEAEELPLSSAAHRWEPVEGSKALTRVPLAPAGADMTTAPSEATRGLAPVGASSAALHFTAPVCPASA